MDQCLDSPLSTSHKEDLMAYMADAVDAMEMRNDCRLLHDDHRHERNDVGHPDHGYRRPYHKRRDKQLANPAEPQRDGCTTQSREARYVTPSILECPTTTRENDFLHSANFKFSDCLLVIFTFAYNICILVIICSMMYTAIVQDKTN